MSNVSLLTLGVLLHSLLSLLLTLALHFLHLLHIKQVEKSNLGSYLRSKNPVKELSNTEIAQIQGNLVVTYLS